LDLAEPIITSDPSYAFARYARVRALAGLDRHNEAIAELDVILETTPDDRWALVTKANLLSDLRRLDDALALLDALLAADADDAFANGVAGWCKARTDPPDRERAADHLRHASELAPDVLWYQGELAVVLGDLGRTDEAAALNKALLARVSSGGFTDASSLSVAGWAAIQLHQVDEAIVHLEDAVELDRSALGNRLTLALALLHAGRGELGVDEYEGVSALAEQLPDPERAAAILIESLGDLQHDRANLPDSVRDDAAEAEKALVTSVARLRERATAHVS
jgi:tetratricopeptide (TPR) repeat protein